MSPNECNKGTGLCNTNGWEMAPGSPPSRLHSNVQEHLVNVSIEIMIIYQIFIGEF